MLFLVHIFKIKKVGIDFIKRCPRYSKVVQNFIRLQLRKPSCIRVEILAVSIPSIHLSNKKTALDYLYPLLSFSVHCVLLRPAGRTDGQTFFEKVFFFLADQEYIYMSIPISTISQILPPFWPKYTFFFLWKWVWKFFSFVSTTRIQMLFRLWKMSTNQCVFICMHKHF